MSLVPSSRPPPSKKIYYYGTPWQNPTLDFVDQELVREERNSLVAWILLRGPNGGLGVISLQVQSDALLMKYLQKLYNRMHLPWVELIVG